VNQREREEHGAGDNSIGGDRRCGDDTQDEGYLFETLTLATEREEPS